MPKKSSLEILTSGFGRRSIWQHHPIVRNLIREEFNFYDPTMTLGVSNRSPRGAREVVVVGTAWLPDQELLSKHSQSEFKYMKCKRGVEFSFRTEILMRNLYKTAIQTTSVTNSRFRSSWSRNRWFISKITPQSCFQARLDQFGSTQWLCAI